MVKATGIWVLADHKTYTAYLQEQTVGCSHGQQALEVALVELELEHLTDNGQCC